MCYTLIVSFTKICAVPYVLNEYVLGKGGEECEEECRSLALPFPATACLLFQEERSSYGQHQRSCRSRRRINRHGVTGALQWPACAPGGARACDGGGGT